VIHHSIEPMTSPLDLRVIEQTAVRVVPPNGPSYRPAGAPHAFTLVELLVVLAVAVLFLGVMIPAVDASREAGRRNACMRNQGRIGEAILAWHQSHDRFPTGVGFSDEAGGCAPFTGRYLWTFTLLPWLGHADVAAMIGPRTWGSEPGTFESYRAFRETIPVYRCPADTHVLVSSPLHHCVDHTQSNYVGCFSPHGFAVEPEASAECLSNHQMNGGQRTTDNPTVLSTDPLRTRPGRSVFNFSGVPRSLASVADGTSRTIMLSEVIAGDGRGVWWTETGVQYSHWKTPNWPGPDRYGGHGSPPLRSTKPGLPDQVPGPGGWPALLFAARSRHPGAVVATAADGSVRIVRDDVAPQVWTALGSMDGGDASTP
jgi:prepilin-type N-terminal cleavage/methylation domain-containing protein